MDEGERIEQPRMQKLTTFKMNCMIQNIMAVCWQSLTERPSAAKYCIFYFLLERGSKCATVTEVWLIVIC